MAARAATLRRPVICLRIVCMRRLPRPDQSRMKPYLP
jgi:hypothetical protein